MSEINPYRNFSSKIKKIYIELPDFSFEHGNVDPKQAKKRFIGRKRIKERLREVLINNKAKTGAYLVTGYRGMGKSSFVNAVINEIGNTETSFKIFWTILLYYFTFIFEIFVIRNLFFDANIFNIVLLVLLPLIYIFLYLIRSYKEHKKTGVYVYREDNKEKSKRIKTFRNIKWGLYRLLIKPFVLTRIIKQKEFHVSLFQFLYINCSFILIIALLNMYSSLNIEYSLATLVILFIGLIKVSESVVKKIIINNRKKSISNDKRNIISFYFEKFINFARRTYDYSSNIFIHINLGYDDLKEEDILRLITRNLKEKYIKTYNKGKALCLNLIWKIVLILFISYFLQINVIKKSHIKFLTTTHLNEYFPAFSNLLYFSPNISNSNKNSEIKENNITIIKNNPSSSSVLLNQNNNVIYTKDDGIFNKIKLVVKSTCNLFDNFFQNATIKIILFINKNVCFTAFDSLVVKYHLCYFNYFLLFYFLLLCSLIKRILRIKALNFMSHYGIIKNLNLLNERIYATYNVEKERSLSYSKTPLPFGFIKKNKFNYPIPDVREIENILIEILDDIQNITGLFKPQLFFIFDELDKIEPQSKIITGEKENEIREIYTKHNPSFTPESTRERQQSIYKLLSNLKYFITTAKAKFIFIAGREIYDASLADVSDRNFFVGSIFHDVIYVDSFLTDPTDEKHYDDVTSMVENYICNLLIPEKYKFSINDNLYTLKDYFEYLLLNIVREEDIFDEKAIRIKRDKISKILEKETKENKPKFLDSLLYIKPEARVKYEKVMLLLYQFIVYLTHSSNGAPKKVTSFFEKHIEYVENPKNTENAYFIQKDYNSKYFLAFDNDNQFKIGLIHYLASPIVLSILDRIKSHDDKLLVSSSFLVDHLFKFSRYGFSWRNIESTYELLDVNKTPELRGFITNIIQYLTRMHLQEMNSGLFSYSFSKKITNEISYLSKISEEASATFNFTLDESLSIKQFYHNSLSRLQERYKYEIYRDNDNNHFIHSIVALHMLIGDLYYYDEEYNDAIVEYMDAVELIRRIEPDKMNPTTIVLFTRNMLKLSLAYEKRKTFDAAYLTLAEITEFLIGYRDINLEKLGLIYIKTFNPANKNFDYYIIDENTKVGETEIKGGKLINIKAIDKRTKYTSEINPLEVSFDYIDKNQKIKNENFSEKILVNGISPLKEKIINKIGTFEGIRLMYQPLLAKLQIIEKSHLGGIQNVDIFRLEEEFKFLQKLLNNKDKYLIECDFYNKMGNILYYKNGFLSENNNIDFGVAGDEHNCTICKSRMTKTPGSYISLPCQACRYYIKSIKSFLKFGLREKEKKIENKNEVEEIDFIVSFLTILNEDFTPLKNLNSTTYNIIGGLLSDIGDIYLSCFKINKDYISNELIEFLREYLFNIWLKQGSHKDDKKKSIERITANFNNWKNNQYFFLIRTILCYYLSAQFYKKADDHKFYSFQYTKILYIIKEILIINKSSILLKSNINKIIEEISETLMKNIIIGYYNTYHDVHRSEVLKIKDIFNFHNITDDIFPKRLTINTDLIEVNLLFAEIKLRFSLEKEEKRRLIKWYYYNSSFSPYALNDTIFNRIQRLKFKTILNFNLMNEFGFKEIKKENESTNIYIIRFILNLINQLYSDDKIKQETMSFFNYFNNLNTSVKNNEELYLKFIRHLITDSIYCLLEVIKMSHTYSINYALNNSYIAFHHKNMVDWCAFYDSFIQLYDYLDKKNKDLLNVKNNTQIDKIKRHEKIKNKIDKINNVLNICNLKEIIYETKDILKNLIGDDNMKFISMRYHAEMALEHYNAARQTHSEGNAYKHLIENMSFLNDDFSDKLNHFSAALERYKLRNGNIKETVENLQKFGEGSNLFNPSYYSIDPLNYLIEDENK